MSDILVAGTTSYPSSIDTATPCVDGAVSGTDQSAVQVNGPAAAVLAVETELGTLPKGTAASVKARLAIALNDDGTIKSSVIAGPQITYSAGVFTISTSLAGQCRLSRTNNTTLTLSRYNGSYLLINNVSQQIPQAGVTVTNGGLSTSTLYYVYAYMVSTTMTLEVVATTHATDTTSGIEIKSGDATRTLVGMVYTGTGSEFLDSATQRFVANWYNRRAQGGVNAYTTNRSTASATYAKPAAEIDIEFLCWGDEATTLTFTGMISVGAGNRGQVSLGVDGTTAEDTFTAFQTGAGVNFYPAAVSITKAFSEGKHLVTVLGNVSGGDTLSFIVVANTAGSRPTLTLCTRI